MAAITSGRRGLRNTGNDCYMNAVIQSLSTLPLLRDFFKSEDFNNCLKKNDTLRTESVIYRLSQSITELFTGQDSSVDLCDLKMAFVKQNPTFNNNNQQDSHEFLTLLLESVDKELKTVSSSSIISILFEGAVRSRVFCRNCRYENSCHQPFFILTLPVPLSIQNPNGRVDLRDCIDLYETEEVLMDWKCERCLCNGRGTKTMKIIKIPPYLIIQLQRFPTFNNLNQIQTKVICPKDQLDLSSWELKPDGTASPETAFELQAVCNHVGDSTGGHYTAYCRDQGDSWLECNDELVYPVDCTNYFEHSTETYLLFYANLKQDRIQSFQNQESDIPCNICNIQFNSSINLIIHMNDIHGFPKLVLTDVCKQDCRSIPEPQSTELNCIVPFNSSSTSLMADDNLRQLIHLRLRAIDNMNANNMNNMIIVPMETEGNSLVRALSFLHNGKGLSVHQTSSPTCYDYESILDTLKGQGKLSRPEDSLTFMSTFYHVDITVYQGVDNTITTSTYYGRPVLNDHNHHAHPDAAVEQVYLLYTGFGNADFGHFDVLLNLFEFEPESENHLNGLSIQLMEDERFRIQMAEFGLIIEERSHDYGDELFRIWAKHVLGDEALYLEVKTNCIAQQQQQQTFHWNDHPPFKVRHIDILTLVRFYNRRAWMYTYKEGNIDVAVYESNDTSTSDPIRISFHSLENHYHSVVVDGTNSEETRPKKRKIHSCNTCGRTFRRKDLFTRHVTSVHGKPGTNSEETRPMKRKIYSCNTCGSTFTRKDHLTRHVTSVHEKSGTNSEETRPKKRKIHSCNTCGRIFSRKDQLARHVQSVHKKRRISCPKCDKTFSRRGFMNDHLRSVHDNQRVPCPICNKQFAYQLSMSKHLRTVHNNQGTNSEDTRHTKKKIHSCNTCGTTFTRKDQLARHVQSVHEKRRISCPKCDKTFSRRNSMNDHFRSVHDSQRVPCPICNKQFAYQVSMSQHLRTVHNNQGTRQSLQKMKIHSCNTCGRTFMRTDHFTKHVASVHGKPGTNSEETRPKKRKIHSCNTCGRIFRRKHHLTRHVTSFHGKLGTTNTEDD